MAEKNPAEAVNNYRDLLQRAISCVTDAVINVRGGYYVSERPHFLTIGDGESVKLDSNSDLRLSISQRYRIIRAEGRRASWEISTVGYEYSLMSSSDQEIIAYHWHPEGQSEATYPHLHLGPAARVGRDELIRAHLPTGRIALEAVLRLLITDFGVRPRRRDWADILEESQTI
jgi:hypothetical protein